MEIQSGLPLSFVPQRAAAAPISSSPAPIQDLVAAPQSAAPAAMIPPPWSAGRAPSAVDQQISDIIKKSDADIAAIREAETKARLDSNQKIIDGWKAKNPWDTIKSGLPSGSSYLSLPKKLTRDQRDMKKKLLKAGVNALYADQLVRRAGPSGNSQWAQFCLHHPPKH